MNLTIHIACKDDKDSENEIFTTNYVRWYTECRKYLFSKLQYAKGCIAADGLPYKFHNMIELDIERKMKRSRPQSLLGNGSFAEIYYHSGGRYFRKCLLEKLSNEYKPLQVNASESFNAIALYSSSLYFWYWVTFSDTYHVTKGDIEKFPVASDSMKDEAIRKLGQNLLEDMQRNSVTRQRNRKDGSVQEEVNFYVNKSKHIIDSIDSCLALHYQLKQSELDFIINYDIKYRMGKELESEGSDA